MFKRARSGWLAGSGAMLLVLAISGVVMGATVLTSDTVLPSEPTEPEVVLDTTATFEDVDGDGVDDDCDDAVEVDTEAADAAFKAADLDSDGTISVSEAAQTGWVGGANCNHGGYVSQVAKAQGDCVAAETEEPAPDEEPSVVLTGFDADDLDEDVDDDLDEDVDDDLDENVPEPAEDEDCAAEDTDEADEAEAPAEDATCEVVPAPEPDPALDPTAPNAHGTWVSSVAKSDAVGGKNCNHGGAVSEAAKKDHEAAAAAREARKAEREAAREARKAEREAAREARKAGKVHGHGH